MTSNVLDLFDRRLYEDGFPHDLFDRLRAESPIRHQVWSAAHSPYPEPAGSSGGAAPTQPSTMWHVFGHREVRLINRDWETFSSGGGPTVPRGVEGSSGLLSLDPPEHQRLRHVVAAAFTPRMIARLERQIDARVEALLDAVGDESCDFVEAVAYPLPMHVIADIIGIPERDRSFVFDKAQTAISALDPEFDAADSTDVIELFGYAQELAADKRARPVDDVWSMIIAGGLAQDDVNVFFMILALAGSETTRNALSHGLLELLSEPALLASVRSDPELLARTGTDELLRFTSPVITFARDVTTKVEIGDVAMEPDDRVVMWHGVANRDPGVFNEPHSLDLTRDPNPHVAFGGGGPHYCLGASLAKREMTSVFNALARRFGDIGLTGPAVWSGPGPISNVGCSITHLPIRLTSR